MCCVLSEWSDSAVQCRAVQCSAVQCSAVQCSAVQCSAVPCSTSMTNACAEAHLPHLTVKKAVESSAEILVSVSRRTISGSFSPALANSCKADGIVAENSSVCANTQHKLSTAHCVK